MQQVIAISGGELLPTYKSAVENHFPLMRRNCYEKNTNVKCNCTLYVFTHRLHAGHDGQRCNYTIAP